MTSNLIITHKERYDDSVDRMRIDERNWRLIKLIKSRNFWSSSTPRDLIALGHRSHSFLHSRFTALPLQRYLHNTFNQNSSESQKQKVSMTSVSRHRSNVKIHQRPLSWKGRGRESTKRARGCRGRDSDPPFIPFSLTLPLSCPVRNKQYWRNWLRRVYKQARSHVG